MIRFNNPIISLVYQYANSTTEPIVQVGAIDALKEYGKQATNAITEVVNSPIIDGQVKAQGLKIIEELSEVDEIKRIQEIGIHSADCKE